MAEKLFKKYMIPTGSLALILLLIPDLPGKILLASGCFGLGGLLCFLDYLGLVPSHSRLTRRLTAVRIRKD